MGKLGTELTNETFGQDLGNVLQDMFQLQKRMKGDWNQVGGHSR